MGEMSMSEIQMLTPGLGHDSRKITDALGFQCRDRSGHQQKEIAGAFYILKDISSFEDADVTQILILLRC